MAGLKYATSQLPEWAERVIDALALIVIAYSAFQAATAWGIDNWIVALAAGVAVAYLIWNYVPAVRRTVRGLVKQIFMILWTVVEAIEAMIEVIKEEYGGNFVAFFLDVLITLLAMKYWSWLRMLPGIKRLIEYLELFAKALHDNLKLWAETAFRWTNEALTFLRKRVEFLHEEAQSYALQLFFMARGELQTAVLGLMGALQNTELRLLNVIDRAIELAEGRFKAAISMINYEIREVFKHLTLRIGKTEVRLDLLDLHFEERAKKASRGDYPELLYSMLPGLTPEIIVAMAREGGEIAEQAELYQYAFAISLGNALGLKTRETGAAIDAADEILAIAEQSTKIPPVAG